MNSWWLNFTGSHYLELVGWSLINSIWQGMIIAAILWTFLSITSKYLSANTRYVAGLCSQILIAVWTVGSVVRGTSSIGTVGNSQDGILFSFSSIASYTQDLTWFEKIMSSINSSLPLFMAFWFLGVTIFLIRIVGGLSFLNRLQSTTRSASKNVVELANELSRRLRITQKFQVLESHALKVPVVIGHLRPLILFPVGMTANLTLDNIRGILAHELAHIKRYDYLVNIIQSVFEAVYFFNPFVWWISAMIREEREHACDNLAMTCINQRRGYVDALIRISEQEYVLNPAFSASITGSNRNTLMKRVKRIMNSEMKNKPMNWLPAIILLAALAIPAFMIAKESRESGLGEISQAAGAGIDLKSFLGETESIAIGPMASALNLQTSDTIPKEREEEIDKDKDEDIYIDIDVDADPDLDIVMDFDIMIAPIVDIDIPPLLHLPPMVFNMMDTFPRSWDEEEWEVFSHSWREEMERFREQMQRFHLEFNEQFRHRFEDWELEHREEMEELQKRLKDGFGDIEMENFRRMEEVFRELEDSGWQEELNEHMRELQEKMEMIPNMEEYIEEMQSTLENELSHLKEFENELNGMLLEDGYIEKGDKVNVEFNDDEIIVNGSKVRDKDQKKYLELRKKYFPRDDGKFRYKMN